MWIIKYIDKDTSDEKVLNSLKFNSYNETFEYISENMKDVEDIWPEEELITDINSDKLDFDTLVGKYIYMMSDKKKDFFCYGLILEISGPFVYIKTRQDETATLDLAFYRIEKIKDLYANNYIKFEENGCLVPSLKEYI